MPAHLLIAGDIIDHPYRAGSVRVTGVTESDSPDYVWIDWTWAHGNSGTFPVPSLKDVEIIA